MKIVQILSYGIGPISILGNFKEIKSSTLTNFFCVKNWIFEIVQIDFWNFTPQNIVLPFWKISVNLVS